MEFEEDKISKLKNSTKIRHQFERALQLYKQIKDGKHPNYELGVNNYVCSDEPDIVFRKMFFIQRDLKSNNGRLVIGDFDNVIFIEKPK